MIHWIFIRQYVGAKSEAINGCFKKSPTGCFSLATFQLMIWFNQRITKHPLKHPGSWIWPPDPWKKSWRDMISKDLKGRCSWQAVGFYGVHLLRPGFARPHKTCAKGPVLRRFRMKLGGCSCSTNHKIPVACYKLWICYELPLRHWASQQTTKVAVPIIFCLWLFFHTPGINGHLGYSLLCCAMVCFCRRWAEFIELHHARVLWSWS